MLSYSGVNIALWTDNAKRPQPNNTIVSLLLCTSLCRSNIAQQETTCPREQNLLSQLQLLRTNRGDHLVLALARLSALQKAQERAPKPQKIELEGDHVVSAKRGWRLNVRLHF